MRLGMAKCGIGLSSCGSKQAWASLDTRWVTIVAIAIVPASVVSNLVIPILVVLRKEPVHASCSLSCSAGRDGANNPTIDDRRNARDFPIACDPPIADDPCMADADRLSACCRIGVSGRLRPPWRWHWHKQRQARAIAPDADEFPAAMAACGRSTIGMVVVAPALAGGEEHDGRVVAIIVIGRKIAIA